MIFFIKFKLHNFGLICQNKNEALNSKTKTRKEREKSNVHLNTVETLNDTNMVTTWSRLTV